MDEQPSSPHVQGPTPPDNITTTKMGSTFVAATEAMQTAVNAMVAAAETLKEQAHKYSEQTSSTTQPRYHDLLAPGNSRPSSLAIPARAASRIRRALTPTPTPVDSMSSSRNDATIPTSTCRPAEETIQPKRRALSRTRTPLRSPHKRFDYGYYRSLTDHDAPAAPAAPALATDDSVPLTTKLSNEVFELLESPNHWPFVPAPQDSTRTLCTNDFPLKLEIRSPYEHRPEDEEIYSRMNMNNSGHHRHRHNRTASSSYRRPHPPSSVYSQPARDLDQEDTEMETLPVMRIGGHTYIRSDTTGDFHHNPSRTHQASQDGHHSPSQPQQQRSTRLQRFSSSTSSNNNDNNNVATADAHQSRFSHFVTPPTPKRPYGFSLAQEIAFVALICLAQLLMLAGMAQALVPQYLIGQSFRGTTPGDLAWYSAAYGLTAGTFVLPSGRLGDVFGHRKVSLLGWGWFALWELAGGFSPWVEAASASASASPGGGSGGSKGGTIFFIVCRALQGLGPALLVPNGQAMLGMAYHAPGPRKNLVMCLFGAAAPLGFVVGAVMSSLFAQVVGHWEYGFFAMAGACVVFGGLSFVILPACPPPRPRPGPESTSTSTSTPTPTATITTSLWTRLDAPGILLGVAGLVLLNFAINQAPIVSWTTPYTYFLLLIGLLLLVAFAHHERVGAAHPLVPIRQLPSLTGFVLGCTAAGWACFSIWCYYAFSFLQQLRGWSPLLAAAGFAPAPVMGLLASLWTGFLFGRKVRPQAILLVSMCAFTTGSLLWATAPVGQSYWLNSFLGILVMPFGMDMSNPAASILLSNTLPRENQGIAASLVVTTVNYSISVALGIAGTAEAAVNGGGKDVLAGYRAGQYVGLGFGGFGIVLASVFWLRAKIAAANSAAMRQHEVKDF